MKLLLLLAFIPMLALASNDQLEQEFEERLKLFIEKENTSNESLQSIWNIGDTPLELYHPTEQSLEILIHRGAKEITFIDIYSAFDSEIENGFEIGGVNYVFNMEPYRMVEWKYEKEKPSNHPGTSMMLGIKDNKLYIMGTKKAEQGGGEE